MINATNAINEERVLDEVMAMSKALIESFKFQMRYYSRVSEEQEKKTLLFLKKYRENNWKMALSKAKGNKKLAYTFYTRNLRQLF
jgi:hypothetical protein